MRDSSQRSVSYIEIAAPVNILDGRAGECLTHELTRPGQRRTQAFSVAPDGDPRTRWELVDTNHSVQVRRRNANRRSGTGRIWRRHTRQDRVPGYFRGDGAQVHRRERRILYLRGRHCDLSVAILSGSVWVESRATSATQD